MSKRKHKKSSTWPSEEQALEFLNSYIRPALSALDLSSKRDERLLLLTAMKESHLHYTRQVGGGPARGMFQIEPATFMDVVGRFVKDHPNSTLSERFYARYSRARTGSGVRSLVNDLDEDQELGAAVCRLRYMYDPQTIPSTLEDQARYWSRVYQTEEIESQIEEAISIWRNAFNGRYESDKDPLP